MRIPRSISMSILLVLVWLKLATRTSLFGSTRTTLRRSSLKVLPSQQFFGWSRLLLPQDIQIKSCWSVRPIPGCRVMFTINSWHTQGLLGVKEALTQPWRSGILISISPPLTLPITSKYLLLVRAVAWSKDQTKLLTREQGILRNDAVVVSRL